jgi:hypothetical protein
MPWMIGRMCSLVFEWVIPRRALAWKVALRRGNFGSEQPRTALPARHTLDFDVVAVDPH